jgi:hypothetical protein
MWRMRRCRWFGHRWSLQMTDGGRYCRRCGKYELPFKQVFGTFQISGPTD